MRNRSSSTRLLGLLAAAGISAVLVAACSGGSGSSASSASPNIQAAKNAQVGTTTTDPNLPAAPVMPALPPANAATCQVFANYAPQSNGLLADNLEQTIANSPAPANNPSAPTNPTAPDTARIQAALNACANKANAYTSSNNIASNGVVELSASGSNNAFLTGPLSMPGGITLVIDQGVTLFASRDPVQYNAGTTGAPTANLPGTPNAASMGAATSNVAGNGTYYCGQIYPNDDGCEPLISNTIYGSTKLYTSNNAIMGPGTIDGQGGRALYSPTSGTGSLPPLITRPDGTNMSWWDLGWEGNEALPGEDENNPRLVEPLYGFNFVMYNITLQNAPKFHITPTGIDGFTAWGVKIFTPTQVYQGMTNYWGANYSYATVKNTDGIDPGSKGSTTAHDYSTSVVPTGKFPGDVSNVLVAYSYISDSDDNMAIKGESSTSDGAVYNITVAHNHFYYGHGMSIGSQTNGEDNGTPSAGLVANTTPVNGVYPSVANINVYDLSMNYTDNGVRIKTNWSEGGLVSNASYTDLCLQPNPNPSQYDSTPQAAVIITPYYSATANKGLYPNFQNISINGLRETGSASWTFEGFNSASANMVGAGWSGAPSPAVVNPLGISLNNIESDGKPLSITATDANMLLTGRVDVSDQLKTSTATNVTITRGSPTPASNTPVDCSQAFVPFPGQAFP